MGTQSSKLSFQDEWDGEDVPEIDYHLQWRNFRLRWYMAALLLYTWIPVCLGLFVLSRFYIHRPLSSLAIMLLWLAAALGAVYWQGEFRCPRCRRRYAALGHKPGDVNYTRGFFDTICSNCKLRKFEHG